jgi:shikimate kinase
MGSGKTSTGQALAKRLGFHFVDLDQLIEKRAGKSVREIFEELGESEFRRLEAEAIADCESFHVTVIALGGGAYSAASSRNALRRLGKTIWLECRLEECIARVEGDSARPLLGTLDEMRVLFDERIGAYSEADFVVDSGDATPEEVALRIDRLFR